ncbi:MAG: DUF3486 family protein [Rhodospirillaceae bacterium]|nr:DUF3486 family protein [Rhodospirillaceae bacterium]
MTKTRTNGTTNGKTKGTNGRAPAETRPPAPGNGHGPRAAIDHDARRGQDLIGRQNAVERAAAGWAGAPGERAAGRTDLLAIEALRTLALSCIAGLGKREEPVEPEEVARLALALSRIEGADRLRVERERTLAEAAARAGGAAQKDGLSTETVSAIRRAVEGEFRR